MSNIHSQEILERRLPSDTDSEASLIAGCIVEPKNIDRVEVRSDQFFDRDLGDMWELLQDMHYCGDPVRDIVAVSARMKGRGLWERMGGLSWIREKFDQGYVHQWHCEFYAKQIIDAAQRRRLIDIGGKLVSDGYDTSRPIEESASSAQAALSARLEIRDDVHQIGHLADGMLKSLDDTKRDKRRVFSGLSKLDEDYGPFMSGELVVVGARTSIGKTAAMIQMALYHADRKRPVLFCSLEMPAEQLRDRIFCAIAGIQSSDFRSGTLTQEQRACLARLTERFRDLPLYIWSPRGEKTITRIAAKARAVKAEFGLDLLMIDYVQKITSTEKRASREEQVASFARGCKDMALDLDIPNIVGCQLNVEADKADEPALHHLRESAVTGHEADVVLLLHRATRHSFDGKLIVAKHRCGSTGSMPMTFDPLHQVITFNVSTKRKDDEDVQSKMF